MSEPNMEGARPRPQYGEYASTEEQRQLVEATEDLEEPATAARGRAAEDRAIPSTSATPDVELAPTASR